MQVPLQVDTRCILQVKLQYLRCKDIHCLVEQYMIRGPFRILGIVHDIPLNKVCH